jgi:cell division protein FtsZ
MPEPVRSAATVAFAPEPVVQAAPPAAVQPAAAMQAVVTPIAQPAPVMTADPSMWTEPKRVAFEAEYDPPATLHFDATPPQTELRAQPAPAPAKAPAAIQPQAFSAPYAGGEPQAESDEEAPLFPERNYTADRRKGGWLGLFGGRGGKAGAYEQPEAPSYRQTAPVSRGGAAAAPAEQTDAMEAADDLDIPSFLRRLAN